MGKVFKDEFYVDIIWGWISFFVIEFLLVIILFFLINIFNLEV